MKFKMQNSRFKIQNGLRVDGNVAIKREQRLLADYAEREQRKDCEAGLIMGELFILFRVIIGFFGFRGYHRRWYNEK